MYIFDFHLDGGQIGQQALDLEVALEAAEELIGGVAAAERFHHHIHAAGRRSVQFAALLHCSTILSHAQGHAQGYASSYASYATASSSPDGLLRIAVGVASRLDCGIYVFRSSHR